LFGKDNNKSVLHHEERIKFNESLLLFSSESLYSQFLRTQRFKFLKFNSKERTWFEGFW